MKEEFLDGLRSAFHDIKSAFSHSGHCKYDCKSCDIPFTGKFLVNPVCYAKCIKNHIEEEYDRSVNGLQAMWRSINNKLSRASKILKSLPDDALELARQFLLLIEDPVVDLISPIIDAMCVFS